MKVAILGNSHVACLILAHRRDPGCLGPDITPVFFAAPGQSMAGMSAKGGALVPETEELRQKICLTSGGVESVALNDYDAFILVAMGYTLPFVPRSYSRAVTERALGRRFEETVLGRLAVTIAAAEKKPVLCGHKPLLAQAPVAGDVLSYDDVLERYDHTAKPLGLSLIGQPAETRQDGLFTRAEFAKGSEGLIAGKAHADDEMSHMNVEYGEIYLRHCAELLRQSV